MSESLSLLARGRNAEVYAMDEARVLKLFYAGFPRDAAAAEFRHARLARRLGVPTPHAERIVELDGRVGIVLERVRGPTLLQLVMAGADSAERLAGVLFDVHAALERVDGSQMPAAQDRLARRIAGAPGVSGDMRRAALDALARLSGGARFCHGDLHPGNVIVSAEGPWLVDWVDAGRAAAGLDAARSLLLLELAPVPRLDPRIRERFLAAYRERLAASGRLAEADPWRLPLAVARLAEPLEAAEREALLARLVSLAG
jgi:Ser/Thr protein kinase RdoA (MazF antagonist)